MLVPGSDSHKSCCPSFFSLSCNTADWSGLKLGHVTGECLRSAPNKPCLSACFPAWLPAPVLYGSAIDTTCLLWQTKCKRKAACQYYDNTLLRQRSGFPKALALQGLSFGVWGGAGFGVLDEEAEEKVAEGGLWLGWLLFAVLHWRTFFRRNFS